MLSVVEMVCEMVCEKGREKEGEKDEEEEGVHRAEAAHIVEETVPLVEITVGEGAH